MSITKPSEKSQEAMQAKTQAIPPKAREEVIENFVESISVSDVSAIRKSKVRSFIPANGDYNDGDNVVNGINYHKNYADSDLTTTSKSYNRPLLALDISTGKTPSLPSGSATWITVFGTRTISDTEPTLIFDYTKPINELWGYVTLKANNIAIENDVYDYIEFTVTEETDACVVVMGVKTFQSGDFEGLLQAVLTGDNIEPVINDIAYERSSTSLATGDKLYVGNGSLQYNSNFVPCVNFKNLQPGTYRVSFEHGDDDVTNSAVLGVDVYGVTLTPSKLKATVSVTTTETGVITETVPVI